MKQKGNGAGTDPPLAAADESSPDAFARQREAEDAQRQYERRFREGKEGPADFRSRPKGPTESPVGVGGEGNQSTKESSLDVSERERQWKARRIQSWLQEEDRRSQYERSVREQDMRTQYARKGPAENPEPVSGEDSSPPLPGIEHQPGRTSPPVPESTTDWSSLRKTVLTIAVVVFAVFIWASPYRRDAYGRASSMSFWAYAAIAVLASMAYAITRSLRESHANSRRKVELDGLQRQRNTELRAWQSALEADVKERQAVLVRREQVLNGRDDAFKKGVASGRRWLAEFIAEASSLLDRERESFLLSKKHPAPSAALIVSETRAEKRELRERLKFLEYQLKSYEEYFPQLEEYRDIILDERVPHSYICHAKNMRRSALVSATSWRLIAIAPGQRTTGKSAGITRGIWDIYARGQAGTSSITARCEGTRTSGEISCARRVTWSRSSKRNAGASQK